MLIKICSIIFVVASLFFPINVFAQEVVINEIFANPEDEKDEFVELYNNSDSEVDLSNWKISDLFKSYSIADLKISGKGYLVLEKSLTKIALNNSNEKVSLIDPSDNVVDSFSYEKTIEGKSWSRAPDGTGSFSNNTEVTKGYQNVSAPTSTPTRAPTPTKARTPTKTPKPTRAPTPIKASVISKTNGVFVSDNNLSNESIDKKESLNILSTPTSLAKVAGATDSKEIESNLDDEDNKSNPAYLYSLVTGLGMIILACVILLYRKFKVKNEEEDF